MEGKKVDAGVGEYWWTLPFCNREREHFGAFRGCLAAPCSSSW